MQIETLTIIFLTIIGFGVIFLFLHKKLSDLKENKPDETLLEWLKSMQSSLESTNKTLNDALHSSSANMVKTLQENSKQLNERLDKAAAISFFRPSRSFLQLFFLKKLNISTIWQRFNKIFHKFKIWFPIFDR